MVITPELLYFSEKEEVLQCICDSVEKTDFVAVDNATDTDDTVLVNLLLVVEYEIGMSTKL